MQSHGLQPQPNGNARIRVHPSWPVPCATSIRITRLDAGLSNRPDVNYRLTAPPNHRSIHLTHMSLFRFLSEYCTLYTHSHTHSLSLSLLRVSCYFQPSFNYFSIERETKIMGMYEVIKRVPYKRKERYKNIKNTSSNSVNKIMSFWTRNVSRRCEIGSFVGK